MIGKIVLAIYAFAEITLATYSWIKKKPIVLGKNHPAKAILGLLMNGATWYVIIALW